MLHLQLLSKFILFKVSASGLFEKYFASFSLSILIKHILIKRKSVL